MFVASYCALILSVAAPNYLTPKSLLSITSACLNKQYCKLTIKPVPKPTSCLTLKWKVRESNESGSADTCNESFNIVIDRTRSYSFRLYDQHSKIRVRTTPMRCKCNHIDTTSSNSAIIINCVLATVLFILICAGLYNVWKYIQHRPRSDLVQAIYSPSEHPESVRWNFENPSPDHYAEPRHILPTIIISEATPLDGIPYRSAPLESIAKEED